MDFIRFGLLVLVANLALTALLVALKPVLNYDGVLYLSAAQAITEGRLQYASELYKGLFYPYLINFTGALTPLSLEYSAHLLNSLLLTVMSLGFIAIVYQLGGHNKRILIISALVILLFPSLLKYRPFIIRDFGFLACYLWSLFFLLKYKQDNSIAALISWVLILVFASFIRIESIGYLCLVGLFILPWKKLAQNIKLIATLTVLIIISSVLLVYSPTSIVEQLSSIHPSLAYPFQYIELAFTKLNRSFSSHTDNSIVITFIKTAGLVIYETLRRLEFIYAIFAFISIKKGWVLKDKAQRYSFICYIVASIIILTLFSTGARYFSSRYTIALALTILVLAPFSLEKIYQHFSSKTKKQQYALAFLALVLFSLSAKRFSPNEHHLESSTGEWVLKNLPNAILASNNSKILYYAKQRFRYHPYNNRHYRFNNRYLLTPENEGRLKQSDYLAFELKRKDEEAVKLEQVFNAQYGSPIKVIKQSAKHYVNIYDLN